MINLLLPPSLQDWLPEDHLARFVADVMNELNSCPPFMPSMNGGMGEVWQRTTLCSWRGWSVRDASAQRTGPTRRSSGARVLSQYAPILIHS